MKEKIKGEKPEQRVLEQAKDKKKEQGGQTHKHADKKDEEAG